MTKNPSSSSTPVSVPARWWTAHGDGSFRCELCPRECILRPGQTGYCHVRLATQHGIETLCYGKTTGIAIDPIEKKPLYHFFPGTDTLSLGTIGCNMGCLFCQNWHISKTSNSDLLAYEATAAMLAEGVSTQILSGHSSVSSISLTYNEPIVFAEYAVDIARQAAALEIPVIAVTAGYISAKAREPFFENIAAANVDLKGFSETFYRDFCQAKLRPVLDTLEHLANNKRTWLEVTTLLIPGLNDSEELIKQQCHWHLDHLGAEVPLHFSAFHPDYQLTNLPPTPAETVLRAREQAMALGLHFVYAGNLASADGSTTFCPKCGKEIVVRERFKPIKKSINPTGTCGFCRTKIPGCF